MGTLRSDMRQVMRYRKQKGLSRELRRKLSRIENVIDILSKSKNPEKEVEKHPVVLGKILYDAFLYKKTPKEGGMPVYEALDTLKEGLENKSSFYVLQLPQTCSGADKEDLGIKIGKSDGQSLRRLRDYHLKYGNHVRLIHIRTFDKKSRNNFLGAKRYELVIKRWMGKITPDTRARTVSIIPEYFTKKSMAKLRETMKTADGNEQLVRSALPVVKQRLKNRKYHGTFAPAPVQPERNTCKNIDRCLYTGVRVLVYSTEQTFVIESKGNVARCTLEGVVKKKNDGNSMTFNVLWDLDDITMETIQRSDVTFNIRDYGKHREGGWVLEKSHMVKQSPWNDAVQTDPMDILGDGYKFSKEVYEYFKTRRELSMEHE